MIRYNTPGDLAAVVAAADRPILIGLDIDGVLSPIVAHADDAALLPGVADALEQLAARDGVVIAAVSGRALSSMRTFGLPDGLQLIGSHGMESADHAVEPLDDHERRCLDRLIQLADDAAERAGNGAWVEHKHASVALHTREADVQLGTAALDELADRAAEVVGAAIKPGSCVLELFARHASKGTAIDRLRHESGAATTLFVGDDVTDEEAFAVLTNDDISVKVGAADTIATHRLADPDAVLGFLDALASLLAPA